MENVIFEKPNPAKFFVFHLMRTQKEISYSFLYYVKGHRCDVMKNRQIYRSLASYISRKLSSDRSESGQMSSNGVTSSSRLCLYVRFCAGNYRHNFFQSVVFAPLFSWRSPPSTNVEQIIA